MAFISLEAIFKAFGQKQTTVVCFCITNKWRKHGTVLTILLKLNLPKLLQESMSDQRWVKHIYSNISLSTFLKFCELIVL